jgi:hypothetical protein
MLNVGKYILAVLFLIGGGLLAGYKKYLGGGLDGTDIASSGLLAVSGAGYILYPLFQKLFGMIKNFKFKMPSFNLSKTAKVAPMKVSSLAEDRIAIDHLMSLGIEKQNKLIIDAMVSINDEVFKLHHQGMNEKKDEA